MESDGVKYDSLGEPLKPQKRIKFSRKLGMKTIEQDQQETSKFSSSRNRSSSSIPAASTPLFSFPIPSTKEFLAGGAGGLGQVLAGHPLDTIKVRLQVQGAAATANQAHFKGPMDCLVQTVRQEGFLGLYKGMAAPLCGVAFVNAVLFSAYGWAKDRIAASTLDSSASLSLSQIAVGKIPVNDVWKQSI